MATAKLYIDIDELGATARNGDHYLMMRRADVEHMAYSMFDCFSDAEADILNRLRAAVGARPMAKVGSGANRGWKVVE